MQLMKTDPGTEMKMNMTPMIDVVFLLIIFFMIITDMTQQELEELVLPIALNATEDKPDPEKKRPIVNIMDDGKIWVMRELYYDPDQPDDYLRIKEFLVIAASNMAKEAFSPGKPVSPTNPLIPDDPLLIRCDQSALFKHVQKVMEQCGQQGIQIWRVQLAASEPAKPKDEQE